ncbi:hypothetical protein B296_00012648 [Ensete ventricosum]|uniref:Protein kinase domain-containing protein n=1 Tax=Ensete ventricosum TaxID=4639 RepID=A0A427B8Y0_ENSVE|nr:hypothetical protein B296_00012648 [Ensete ventricosum]
MPWWNRKNAVSPSSPSSSSYPSSVASSPGGRRGSRDLHLPWSSRRDAQRRFSRQHERPNLFDIKVGGLSFDTGASAGPCSVSSMPVSPRSSNLNCNPGWISSSPVLLPRPLPLPEFVATAPASPHRECTSDLGLGLSSPKFAGCPLPSPKGASSRSEGNETTHAPAEWASMVDPINEKAVLGGVVGSPLCPVRPPPSPSLRPNHRFHWIADFTRLLSSPDRRVLPHRPSLFWASSKIDDQFYIYLEYVHPGSINKYVHRHCGAMTESVVRNFTRHILKGLAYLHGKDIMHRYVSI